MYPESDWKEFLKQNKWIIAAFVFFIAWKFFLIGTLWENRTIPPGPDDSYIYILHLDASVNCDNLISCNERIFNFGTYAGFDHLSYRVLLGSVGKILHLSATETYHISFYLGTFLLPLVLILFLFKLNPNSKNLTAFSLFTLALYNGSGSYHGFYWVVPSFFALIFFLLILSIAIDDQNKHWKMFLPILVPLAIYTHVLGLYLLFILPFFIFFYSLFTKKFQFLIFKKTLFIGGLAFLLYLPVAVYFAQFSYGNPYGPDVIVRNIISQKTSEEGSLITGTGSHQADALLGIEQRKLSGLFPGWRPVYSDYFRWIFPSFIGYIIFLFSIGILIYRKQYKILSLYLASLCFVAVSTLSIHGERALIIIWPLTFLLYAQAAWLALQIISEKVPDSTYKAFFRTLIIIAIFFAVVISSMYSYLWNFYLNKVRNIQVSPNLTEFLVNTSQPSEKVAFSQDMNFLDAYLLLEYGNKKPTKTIHVPEATRYITLEQEKKQEDLASYESIFKKFFNIISRVLHFNKYTYSEKVTEDLPFSHDLQFVKEKKFDTVEIYRVNPLP